MKQVNEKEGKIPSERKFVPTRNNAKFNDDKEKRNLKTKVILRQFNLSEKNLIKNLNRYVAIQVYLAKISRAIFIIIINLSVESTTSLFIEALNKQVHVYTFQ